MSIFEGWNIFGGKKKKSAPTVPDKVEPPDVVPFPTPAPPDPVEPAPAPAEPMPPVTPPPSSARQDHLYVDGEEVDSYLDEDSNVVVKTKLSAIHTAKGEKGTLRLVLKAEPLANPADRQALKDALHQIAPHTKYLGSHQIHVVAWPIRSSPILMSNHKVVNKVGDVQIHMETQAADYQYFKVYCYGDEPMLVEIEIPFNISKKDIPEWAWPAFKIDWFPRRLPGTNEMEHAEKEVLIS